MPERSVTVQSGQCAFGGMTSQSPPSARQRRLAPRQALGRPVLARIVIIVESGRAFGKGDPRQLRARVDVDVGRDGGGIVERADPHEAQRDAAAIMAPNGGLAVRAAMDDMRSAAVGRDGDSDRLPERISTRDVSISALMTKALPVCRWQSLQWQQ